MIANLAFDVVELVPCVPATESPALREVAFRANAWTGDEIAALHSLFAADQSFDDIAKTIGRPVAGVKDKALTLGLRRYSTRKWSELEDAYLCKNYGTVAAAMIAQELGRGCPAVYVRAQLLGLSETNPPPWTAWEDAQLRAGYEQAIPLNQIAALIGRPMAGTGSRASKLGLNHPCHPLDWSEEESARALELCAEGHRYLQVRRQLVAEGFPERSKIGFGQHVRLMGYGRGWGRKWLPEEDELLRKFYADGTSLTNLGTRLARSKGSLKWRAKYLKLQGTHKTPNGFRQGPDWSPEDDTFLRANYGKMKTRDLAAALGRPKGGVFNRAFHLKLKHGYWRHYTAAELRAIDIAFRHDIAIADLAIALGRHAMTVSKYCTDKRGLNFGRRRRVRPPLTLDQILALDAA